MSNEQANNETGTSPMLSGRPPLHQELAVLSHLWFTDVLKVPVGTTTTEKVERWGLTDEGHLYPTGEFIDAEVCVPGDN